MGYCPSHDWDRHCDEQDKIMNNEWVYDCQPKSGLFSKFSVFKNDFHIENVSDECGVESFVTLIPEERSSFVLIPYNNDGSVQDDAAIAALYAYAETTDNIELRQGIIQWLSEGNMNDFIMNQPHQDSPEMKYYG